MQSGEWTRTQALVLASAIEALILQAKEQAEPESDSLELVERLRLFRDDDPFRMRFGATQEDELTDPGYGHMDNWILEFEPNWNHVFKTKVHVQMACCSPRTCQYGHKWEHRNVSIVVPVDTRPGENTWEFRSDIGQPLEISGHDHWSAD